MHDIDRTSLEMVYGEQEADEYGYSNEDEGGYYGEAYYGESPLNEAEEMEYAAELLSISNEQDLDLFLGKLFRKASSAIGKLVKSPVGKALGGVVKGAIKTALPVVGSAAGNFLLPGVGGAIGGQLASGVGSMLGLELEGLSEEDQEYEIARQLVRFASAAARHAAEIAPTVPPPQAAQQAAVAAAQQYAPGMLRPSGGQATGQPAHGKGHCRHPQSGRWVRKGNSIILLGA